MTPPHRPPIHGLSATVLMEHFFDTYCDKIPNASGSTDTWHLNEMASKLDVYDYILQTMNKGDPEYVLMKDRPQRKRARQGLMADAQEAVLRMEKRAREGEYAHMTLPHHIDTHPPPLLNPSNMSPSSAPTC